MGDGTTKGQNPPAGHFAGLRDPGNARDEYLIFAHAGTSGTLLPLIIPVGGERMTYFA